MSAPQVLCCHLRDRSLDCLALTTNGTSIHKSHRTVANKKEVLKCPSHSLSQKRVYLHSLKAYI